MNYRDPLAAAQARNEQLERELVETRAQAEQAARAAQAEIARAHAAHAEPPHAQRQSRGVVLVAVAAWLALTLAGAGYYLAMRAT